MKKLQWAELMRLGLRDLRLDPATFWQLTPVELLMIASTEQSETGISRHAFADLAARFPDRNGTASEKTE